MFLQIGMGIAPMVIPFGIKEGMHLFIALPVFTGDNSGDIMFEHRIQLIIDRLYCMNNRRGTPKNPTHLLYFTTYCRASIALARYTSGAFQLMAISLLA